MQEKYGKGASNGAIGPADDSDSESESEDDEGELVTEQLDAEIFDTLKAIQTKDPRVYDKSVTFYTPEGDADAMDDARPNGKSKPMYLKDYHRKNLLDQMDEAEGGEKVPTYAEEQSNLKQDLLKQMHAVPEDEEMEDDFLVRKPGKKSTKQRQTAVSIPDVSTADRDPETFLSNFMASRAWLPSGGSKLQPFESDDEDEERRADEFEEAYNLRFEDPQHANEKLLSHSRDAAAKYSVRREEPKGRKRARELQKAEQDAEKLQRQEEKARYRNLKIDEAQEKLNRFKEAAGLKRDIVPVEEWSKFLDDGWDDEKWDREMEKRFGEAYYAAGEGAGSDDEEQEDEPAAGKRAKKKNIKKPKWDDDIDLADILPDFVEEDKQSEPAFALSDLESGDEGEDADAATTEPGTDQPLPRKKSKKDIEQQRANRKKQARKERRKLEELVDQSLATELAPTISANTSRFHYRETSPTTFGLSAREILMADDAALNQFVGLKKLASYRDAEKKSRDRKRLGKKARLRQWRKETFGDEAGPRASFQEYLGGAHAAAAAAEGGHAVTAVDITTQAQAAETRKTKKRSRKGKGRGEAGVGAGAGAGGDEVVSVGAVAGSA